MYIRNLVLSALMTLPFSMVHANDWWWSFTETDRDSNCNQDMTECKVDTDIKGGGHKKNFVVACENKDGMQYIPKTVEVQCHTKPSDDQNKIEIINYKEGSKDYRMKVARPNSTTGEYQVFGFYMDNKNDTKKGLTIYVDCSEPATKNIPGFSIKNDQNYSCGPTGGGGDQTYQEVIDDGGIQIYDGTATFDLIQCKNTQKNCYR